MNETNAKFGGLEERFLVLRRDGRPMPDPHGYVVLDLTGRDKAAEEALLVYADEAEAVHGNHQLAAQLRSLIGFPQSHGFQTGDDAILVTVSGYGKSISRIVFGGLTQEQYDAMVRHVLPAEPPQPGPDDPVTVTSTALSDLFRPVN